VWKKNFQSNNYWSATENSSNNAYNVNFNNGNTNNNNKTNNNYVRCVRGKQIFGSAKKPRGEKNEKERKTDALYKNL